MGAEGDDYADKENLIETGEPQQKKPRTKKQEMYHELCIARCTRFWYTIFFCVFGLGTFFLVWFFIKTRGRFEFLVAAIIFLFGLFLLATNRYLRARWDGEYEQ